MAKKIDLYSETGKKQGTVTLPKVFDVKIKLETVSQAYRAENSKKILENFKIFLFLFFSKKEIQKDDKSHSFDKKKLRWE